MSEVNAYVCGKCGDRTYSPFVPDDAVNALSDSCTASELCRSVVRCGLCADTAHDMCGMRYVSLAAVEVARQYGGLQRVPPNILARHRRMLPPDFPAGC